MKNQNLSDSRAKSLEKLDVVFDKYFNPVSYKRSIAFKPKPDDIIISPYDKCGSAWCQKIVHGLRTRGSMGFD